MTLPPRLEIPPAAVTPPSINPKDSPLALTSLITGILGWTILPLLGSITAIITGHLGKKEIKESHGALTGDGMATTGLRAEMATTGLILGYSNRFYCSEPDRGDHSVAGSSQEHLGVVSLIHLSQVKSESFCIAPATLNPKLRISNR